MLDAFDNKVSTEKQTSLRHFRVLTWAPQRSCKKNGSNRQQNIRGFFVLNFVRINDFGFNFKCICDEILSLNEDITIHAFEKKRQQQQQQ